MFWNLRQSCRRITDGTSPTTATNRRAQELVTTAEGTETGKPTTAGGNGPENAEDVLPSVAPTEVSA